MADELKLEIVTPEQMTFRGVVEEVTIPGTEGQFGVLKGHAALLSSVDIGELSFTQDHKKTYYAVNTGYAEVTASKVTVLVETAERFDLIDRERAKRAREQADVIIVSYHWGTEYETKHNAEQESIAKATIDAGAKLVIGHHPHVQQEIEAYKDGWIAYSLGNFVFDQYFQPEVMQSRIFEVTFKGKDIIGTRDIPVTISRQSQPSLAEDAESGI